MTISRMVGHSFVPSLDQYLKRPAFHFRLIRISLTAGMSQSNKDRMLTLNLRLSRMYLLKGVHTYCMLVEWRKGNVKLSEWPQSHPYSNYVWTMPDYSKSYKNSDQNPARILEKRNLLARKGLWFLYNLLKGIDLNLSGCVCIVFNTFDMVAGYL